MSGGADGVGRHDDAVDGPLLEVSDLHVSFPSDRGEVEALAGVGFGVDRGRTVALVGESGSGKSVTALSVMGLLDHGRITSGSVRFRGSELVGTPQKELRELRGNRMSMVFQNPMSALDPLYTLGNQISEVLLSHGLASRSQARRRAVELLGEVGIPDPVHRVRAYPHQLSGGQRQRVVIAMAIASGPDLLIADEPTTALDVTVEAQILELIRELQDQYGTAVMFITHDIAVVAEMADDVVVLYAGQVVERGRAERVLASPQHPYTRALLESIPKGSTPRDVDLPAIAGSVPSLTQMPTGCRFQPRCPAAFGRCAVEEPPLFRLPAGRESRCWLAEDDQLVTVGAGHGNAAGSTFVENVTAGRNGAGPRRREVRDAG
ncbi:MAG: ABC transporter ATP-binding protein [Actinomycetota bacterium]|nr:ABC transporter ATP-binding protein [Actinomycetota bacterium]